MKDYKNLSDSEKAVLRTLLSVSKDQLETVAGSDILKKEDVAHIDDALAIIRIVSQKLQN